MSRWIKYNYLVIPILYVFVALFATNRNYFLPPTSMPNVLCDVSQFNNFVIFKSSFFHLIHDFDLYRSYPNEHYDLFKYTPTFSLFMVIFAYLPNYIGLLIWNLLNVLVPLYAIHQVIGLSQKNKAVFMVLMLPEFFTTILNSQSNGLILGLLILSFVNIQRNHTGKAVFFTLLTAFIKLFGVFFFAVFLLYPKQILKSVKFVLCYGLILFVLPLLVVDIGQLKNLYFSYFELLKNDGSQFVKYSFTGWLNQWFSFYPSKNLVVLFGLIIQSLPLLMVKLWTEKTKIVYACTLLIWMVIFNHMAESATYIIAVGAIYLAFSTSEKLPLLGVLLIFFMFFTAELGPSDLYPKSIRIWIIETAQLKAFSCILIWFYLILGCLFSKFNWLKSGRVS